MTKLAMIPYANKHLRSWEKIPFHWGQEEGKAILKVLLKPVLKTDDGSILTLVDGILSFVSFIFSLLHFVTGNFVLSRRHGWIQLLSICMMQSSGCISANCCGTQARKYEKIKLKRRASRHEAENAVNERRKKPRKEKERRGRRTSVDNLDT